MPVGGVLRLESHHAVRCGYLDALVCGDAQAVASGHRDVPGHPRDVDGTAAFGRQGYAPGLRGHLDAGRGSHRHVVACVHCDIVRRRRELDSVGRRQRNGAGCLPIRAHM